MKKRLINHGIAIIGIAVAALLSIACVSVPEEVLSAPSVDVVPGLNYKLAWLQQNAQSGGNYTLEVDADERITMRGLSYNGFLSFKDRSDITIILKGVGSNRTIMRNSPDTVFTVWSGVTLVLDENITLRGQPYNQPGSGYFGVVDVKSGGTLVMNNGSTITGGTNNWGTGGGVDVSDGGTFIMRGGTISNNLSIPGPRAAQASALGQGFGQSLLGTPPGLTPSAAANESTGPVAHGGGVYVSNRGTFIKTGGTITGFASDQSNGNVVRGPQGNILQSNGHAVFAGNKRKETTAGPEVNFSYNGTTNPPTFSGAWDN